MTFTKKEFRLLKYFIHLHIFYILFTSNIYWLTAKAGHVSLRLIVIAVEVVIPNCLNSPCSRDGFALSTLYRKMQELDCPILMVIQVRKRGDIKYTSADSWMCYNRMLTTWSLEAFYRNHPKLQIHFVVRKKDYSDKFSFNLNLIYLSSEIKWELMIAL